MSFGIPVRNGLMLGLTASTALSTRGGYRAPAMFLNFLQPFLDSRITFSRGTNATLIDSTGRLTYAPNNLLTWSEDFSNAAWAKTNATITANSTTAPDGTLTADTFTATAANGLIRNDPAKVGTFINSIYVKRKTGAGAVQLLDAAGIYRAITVTSEWTRVDYTATTATVSLFGIRLAGSGDEIYIWGAQQEQVTYQTTPSTYVATTAFAYYGPRFDYDPVTLAPRGLLIEEARTNLLTYSEQFDNAAWVKSNATVSANSTIAPDGVLTADTLVSSVTNTAKHISQSGIASTVGTFTVYAKAAGETTLSLWLVGATVGAIFTLTGSGSTTLNGATSSSIQQLANGWYRCSVYSSSATTTAHIYLRNGSGYVGDGTSGVYLYGAQLEAGSFATSYIPTVASTVTRNADVATMTGTNFSSWYNQSEGTFVAEATKYAAVDGYIFTADAGAAANLIGGGILASGAGFSSINASGVAQAFQSIGTSTPNSIVKLAVAAATNNANVALNGATATTDTTVTMPVVDRLQLGSYVGVSTRLNGHIRTIAYFNTRLPNAQLQTLTAPSLATTLSLDFTSGSYNVGF